MRKSRAPRIGVLVGATIALIMVALPAASAQAAPGDTGYASWVVSAGPAPRTITAAMPAGFPAMTVTTDAPSPSAGTGATIFLPAGRGFGAVFGSSQGQSYLSIGSANASYSTVSSFATPTPAAGWGFALGDIDAETVRVSARDAAGNPVAAAALGFQGQFNSQCASVACEPALVITPGADYVEVSEPLCVQGGDTSRCDTNGSTVWFAPTVALGSVAVQATGKVGSPTYQTWFAATGSVAGAVACPAADTVVELLSPAGTVLTSGTAGAQGYSFGSLMLQPGGYQVQLRAGGVVVEGPAAVSFATGIEQAADFGTCPPPVVVPPTADPGVAVPAVPAQLPPTGVGEFTAMIVVAGLSIILGLAALGFATFVRPRRQ